MQFNYLLPLSDVGEIKDGENINIIRDAVFMYRPNKRWNLSFGQTKLPKTDNVSILLEVCN